MSELLFHLSPRRATTPITSRGNALWRGDERFLVKGVTYAPRLPGADRYAEEGRIDPLTVEYLEDLQRDIHLIRELGLNTILVHALDPSKDHGDALRLLESQGIYVLVRLFRELKAEMPGAGPAAQDHQNVPQASNQCPRDILSSNLKLVDELSKHPNVLGFIISGTAAFKPGASKMASTIRACIRDTKAFIRHRDHRPVLVGADAPDVMMQRLLYLKYISAGTPLDRADFFAMQCYSWAGKSSFQISGWSSICRMYGPIPIPMILSEFGTAIYKPRMWQEIECLYSPDMTGTFSGGCMYTFFENGTGYGLVKVDGMGRRLPKRGEMANLRKRFRIVNVRSEGDLLAEGLKDYEGWRGEFPPTDERWWVAKEEDVPAPPSDWNGIVEAIDGYSDAVVLGGDI